MWQPMHIPRAWNNGCSIYPMCPNCCVGLQAGDEQCQDARPRRACRHSNRQAPTAKISRRREKSAAMDDSVDSLTRGLRSVRLRQGAFLADSSVTFAAGGT